MKQTLLAFGGALSAVLLVTQAAYAVPVIAFEWTEGGAGNGSNSVFNSFHNATGPVLADDFTPAVSGNVVQVDWWGSAGIAGAPNQWEVTFHNDAVDASLVHTPSYPFVSQHFVDSAGADPDGDGVFFFSAAWSPQDAFITAGQGYWFSVANASTNNWLWADPGSFSPSIGTENWDALQSVGGEPSVIAGPHDGPWGFTDEAQGFAFRIWVDAEIPEPGTILLLGLGMLGVLATASKRNRRRRHGAIASS
jgi:hypothetical protein